MSLPGISPAPFVPPGREPRREPSDRAWMDAYRARRAGLSQNDMLGRQVTRLQDRADENLAVRMTLAELQRDRGVIERARRASRGSQGGVLSRFSTLEHTGAGCELCATARRMGIPDPGREIYR